MPNKINFGVEAAKIALGDKKTISSRIAGGIEKTIGGMGGAAKAAPGTTLAFETLAGVGATGGAGAAEEMFPGEPLPRLIGEFGGGISLPVTADPLRLVCYKLFEAVELWYLVPATEQLLKKQML